MAQVIGFIGLGIMGRPMARNLIKAGYPLVVHNRSRAAVDELVGAGAKGAASPRDVARQCDVLITMLPNSPDVELVTLGKDGIIEGARSGLLFVDMSTISPIVSQKVGKALEAKGVRMLDAPVSGGEKGAIDGALSIMAGGDKAVFDTVLPIFQAMGKTITYLGPLGFGGFTKLANQIIVAVNLTATMIWLASLVKPPKPSGPRYVIVLPMAWKIGSTVSNTALSPPAMMESAPSMAPFSPPDTGASNILTPLRSEEH